MIVSATVVGLSCIEEEAILAMGAEKLCCFVDYSPMPIELGQQYQLDFEYTILGEYQISFFDVPPINPMPAFSQIGDSFAYVLSGMFFQGQLYVGEWVFFDEHILAHYGSGLN